MTPTAQAGSEQKYFAVHATFVTVSVALTAALSETVVVLVAAVAVTAAVALVAADGLTSGITTEEFFLLLSSRAAYLFLSVSR